MGSCISKAICWLIGCSPRAMGYDDRGKGAWMVCTRCYRDLTPRATRKDKGE